MLLRSPLSLLLLKLLNDVLAPSPNPLDGSPCLGPGMCPGGRGFRGHQKPFGRGGLRGLRNVHRQPGPDLGDFDDALDDDPLSEATFTTLPPEAQQAILKAAQHAIAVDLQGMPLGEVVGLLQRMLQRASAELHRNDVHELVRLITDAAEHLPWKVLEPFGDLDEPGLRV